MGADVTDSLCLSTPIYHDSNAAHFLMLLVPGVVVGVRSHPGDG
jgi:hypothetical protein